MAMSVNAVLTIARRHAFVISRVARCCTCRGFVASCVCMGEEFFASACCSVCQWDANKQQSGQRNLRQLQQCLECVSEQHDGQMVMRTRRN